MLPIDPYAVPTGDHILFVSPRGRIAIFSVEDACNVFNHFPAGRIEVYAVRLSDMKAARIDCVSAAVDFFTIQIGELS
jgi:hypothetical protein